MFFFILGHLKWNAVQCVHNIGRNSVSYTHLDVYKRQGHGIGRHHKVILRHIVLDQLCAIKHGKMCIRDSMMMGTLPPTGPMVNSCTSVTTPATNMALCSLSLIHISAEHKAALRQALPGNRPPGADASTQKALLRPEPYRTAVKAPARAQLTPELLANLLASEAGGRKAVGDRSFYVVLNQVDTKEMCIRDRA